MWKPNRINVHIVSKNRKGVHGLIEVIQTNSKHYFISAIYASTDFSLKKIMV